MSEVLQQTCPPKRNWRLPCWDISGQVAVGVIDCDHGAVRVGVSVGEWEDFFELRGEQVIAFREAMRAKPVRWEGRCFDRWGQPGRCLIEMIRHKVVRISCVAVGERECCLELQGEQVRRFQVALGEAIEVFYTDVAEHGHHWADDETEDLAVSRDMKVYKMVAAQAPSMVALVPKINDPMITAWCFSFVDGTEVYSACADHVHSSFSSVEQAQKLLSAHGKTKLRRVPVAEALEQIRRPDRIRRRLGRWARLSIDLIGFTGALRRFGLLALPSRRRIGRAASAVGAGDLKEAGADLV